MSGLVLARLRAASLARAEPTAPYWVAMGAASISVLAAASLPGSAWTPAGAERTAATCIAVGLWVLASVLIPPLVARSAWRHLGWREPVRYRLDLWMVVFPAGMYATASVRLGTSAHLTVVGQVGLVAAWPAAVLWGLVFAAMAAGPVGRRSRPGRQS